MRLRYTYLITAIAVLATSYGLRAQDTGVVPCYSDPLVYTYCYVNNDDHTWQWQDTCGMPIVLQFTSGSIESSAYDHLVIYDGWDASAPILFMNTNGPEDLQLDSIGWVVSSSSAMFMELTSNGTNSCATGLLGAQSEWTFSAGDASTVSGSQEQRATNFTLYPNPASTRLNMRLASGTNGPAQLEILDVAGRVVYRDSFTATAAQVKTVDLHGLQSGTYSVVLTTPQGEKTQRLQVIR